MSFTPRTIGALIALLLASACGGVQGTSTEPIDSAFTPAPDQAPIGRVYYVTLSEAELGGIFALDLVRDGEGFRILRGDRIGVGRGDIPEEALKDLKTLFRIPGEPQRFMLQVLYRSDNASAATVFVTERRCEGAVCALAAAPGLAGLALEEITAEGIDPAAFGLSQTENEQVAYKRSWGAEDPAQLAAMIERLRVNGLLSRGRYDGFILVPAGEAPPALLAKS